MWRKRWVVGLAWLIGLPVLLAAGLWAWMSGIDFSHSGGNREAVRSDLAWLPPMDGAAPSGRVLAVVSSTPYMLDGQHRAGYELSELARAYGVFKAAGLQVDIASPAGGEPPKVLDDDLVDADYAFLNDPQTSAAIATTQPLDEVDPDAYQAVYVVGGKGAMLDLHANPALRRIIATVYEAGGVISAVCHGPAALLDVPLTAGGTLLANRQVTGFSNAEERFLMETPERNLGFLLQDALAGEGRFREGTMYLEHVVQDGRLVTGQNPWSTWAVAEAAVRALGLQPAARPRSSEERAVDLLAVFASQGFDAARQAKPRLGPVDNRLLLMHGAVAMMQGDLLRALDLARLARG
jgi:putative intracellular protease/amidase